MNFCFHKKNLFIKTLSQLLGIQPIQFSFDILIDFHLNF